MISLLAFFIILHSFEAFLHPSNRAMAKYGARLSTIRGLKTNLICNAVVPGVGEEGCRLPSPSGINMKPVTSQAMIFFGIWAALMAGTTGLVNGIDFISAQYPDFMNSWKLSWPLLGPLYTIFGVLHFTLKKDFSNSMPYKGAWGIWYLPFPPEFHVIWTGIAEIIGGLWLTVGGLAAVLQYPLPSELGPIESDGALFLLLLTIAVTPANIFMYTHGAKLPIDSPEVRAALPRRIIRIDSISIFCFVVLILRARHRCLHHSTISGALSRFFCSQYYSSLLSHRWLYIFPIPFESENTIVNS